MIKLMHLNDEMGGNISPNLCCKLCVKMDIYFTKFMFQVMNMMKEFLAEFRGFCSRSTAAKYSLCNSDLFIVYKSLILTCIHS